MTSPFLHPHDFLLPGRGVVGGAGDRLAAGGCHSVLPVGALGLPTQAQDVTCGYTSPWASPRWLARREST